MKLKLTTLSLMLLFSSILCGQTMTFKGKVIGNSVPSKGKLYYAKQGDTFSKKKFIKYNENNEYKFAISLKKIQKDSINQFYFTTNLETKQTDKYGCYYKIDISEILEAKERLSYFSELDFYTDLLITENCDDNFEIDLDARENGLGDIVSHLYKMESSGKKYYVTLWHDYSYTGQLYKVGSSYMSSEIGSWNYNKDTKTLTIKVVKERNSTLGLVKIVDRTYELKLNEDEPQLTFESNDIKLFKNNR